MRSAFFYPFWVLIMKTITKLILIPMTTALLMLNACSDKNKPSDTAQSTESSSSKEGNWKAKPSELSTANATDIKSDLAQLNQITSQANSKAVALQDEAKSMAQDPEKLKEILAKSQVIQQDMHQHILGLNLKSAEVQNIRVQMIDNLMTSSRLFELSKAAGFNLSTPSDEFKQLAQRSQALQHKIGTELNTLNQQYAQ